MKRIREHQDDLVRWHKACLGPESHKNSRERFYRALEELTEIGQCLGIPKEDYDAIFNQVHAKPVETDVSKECGGAQITLLLLINSLGVDAESALEKEKARCWTNIEKIRNRHTLKHRVQELDKSIPGVINYVEG